MLKQMRKQLVAEEAINQREIKTEYRIFTK